ncbi:hypothetical protein KCU77_g11122, partial [Aureobasidium melanogenum]|jgi:hypothetical protein
MMRTQAAAESTWPVVGQKDPNLRAHGRKIQDEISAMMECARGKGKNGKSKGYPQGKVNELFRSMLEFIDKAPGGPGVAMQPEAPTKDDWDAFAAKLLETVSTQPRVSPTTSRALSYVEALTNSPAQSIPQSALTRMTTSSKSPISTRQAREIKVKTNFNSDNRPRAGHSRTSMEIVNMANEGIEKAGLLQGPPGTKVIEAATVQVSGDYLLFAKDGATAERLIYHGPDWVACLGGNAEVVTPTYGVMVMNIPVTTFNPDEQEQMRHMLIGANYQLLADHKVSHMNWLLKPKNDKATGTMVVSFTTKVGANAALAAGCIAWEGQMKRTIKYSSACRVLQCFKCYQYGHTTRKCRNEEACGHCAREHLTKDCPTPVGDKTCALCKGNHPAWAQSCKYRQKEMERVETEKEKVRLQPFYPEDPVVSPGPSERGSVVSFAAHDQEETMTDAPTPSEAASFASGAIRIASPMGSQNARPRNQALSSILKKTPQRTRAAAAAKARVTGIITPLQAKKRTFGSQATSSPQEERQCEPASDAIEVIDPEQIRGSSPPLVPDQQWVRVSDRRSSRTSTSRTQETTTDNE